jgi:mono/diheme cytochrome c family protein
MNRKLLGLAAALMLILALAACAPPTKQAYSPPTATLAPVEDTDHDVDGEDQQDADTDDAADTDADTDDAADADTDDSEAMATPINVQGVYDAMGCAECHGENREGLFAPALLPDKLTSNPQFYIDTITNGRRQMPSWVDKLTSAEIEALVNWLMTTAE